MINDECPICFKLLSNVIWAPPITVKGLWNYILFLGYFRSKEWASQT